MHQIRIWYIWDNFKPTRNKRRKVYLRLLWKSEGKVSITKETAKKRGGNFSDLLKSEILGKSHQHHHLFSFPLLISNGPHENLRDQFVPMNEAPFSHKIRPLAISWGRVGWWHPRIRSLHSCCLPPWPTTKIESRSSMPWVDSGHGIGLLKGQWGVPLIDVPIKFRVFSRDVWGNYNPKNTHKKRAYI